MVVLPVSIAIDAGNVRLRKEYRIVCQREVEGFIFQICLVNDPSKEGAWAHCARIKFFLRAYTRRSPVDVAFRHHWATVGAGRHILYVGTHTGHPTCVLGSNQVQSGPWTRNSPMCCGE